MSGGERREVSVAEVFEAYGRYVAGLDDLCQQLREKYWQAMRCRPGCVDCCSRDLSVFPVEASWMRRSFGFLSSARRRQIEAHVRQYPGGEERRPCSLLLRGRCLLYAARPLICRTEGFLLAYRSPDGRWQVSACPHNFRQQDLQGEIPESDLINLESMNQSLAVLNHAYVRAAGWRGPERVQLSEVLGPRPESEPGPK